MAFDVYLNMLKLTMGERKNPEKNIRLSQLRNKTSIIIYLLLCVCQNIQMFIFPVRLTSAGKP